MVIAEDGERAGFVWSGRLARVALFAGITLACDGVELMGPCVRGIEPGNVFGARLLERYDGSGSFEYDPSAYFGGYPVADRLIDCNAGRDLVFGETLVIDAVRRFTPSDGQGCGTLGLSIRDTQKTAMGSARLTAINLIGGVVLGTASHPSAVVDGCLRGWTGQLLVRDGNGPYDSAVPGEVPPVLLHRLLPETHAPCEYSEPLNECVFVVELEHM